MKTIAQARLCARILLHRYVLVFSGVQCVAVDSINLSKRSTSGTIQGFPIKMLLFTIDAQLLSSIGYF